MDAMALLCTLHADGPATLKRMREAGLSTLEALAASRDEDIARILGSTPAVARRFQREASLLARRMGPGVLDREESAESPARRAVDARRRAIDPRVALPSMHGDDLDATPPGAAGAAPSLTYREQKIVEHVLDSWRERDAQDGPRDHAPSQACAREPHEAGRGDDGPAEAARARYPDDLHPDARTSDRIPPASSTAGVAPRDGAASRRTSSPARGADPSSILLHAGLVDGLDEELSQRLREAGVQSLAGLAAIEPLSLSQTLGLGYTRLLRLRGLARRFAGEPAITPRPVRPAPAHRPEKTSLPLQPLKFSRAEVPCEVGSALLGWDFELELKALHPEMSKMRAAGLPAREAGREGAGGPFV